MGLRSASAETQNAGKPDAGNPDAGKPDAGNPDAGTPGVGNPEAATRCRKPLCSNCVQGMFGTAAEQ